MFFFILLELKWKKKPTIFYLLSWVPLISASGSEEQTPKASVPHHHTASSHAKQSPSLAAADNDEEPVGDCWDDDEDWGSLEVGFLTFFI